MTFTHTPSGASIKLVRKSFLITDRTLRKWINLFNQSGVDELIVKKRPGRTAIIKPEKIYEFSEPIDHPQRANRTFWTAKAFHGYISDTYQIDCSHESVCDFFISKAMR
jgi:transposase